jgi:hypothetical protein
MLGSVAAHNELSSLRLIINLETHLGEKKQAFAVCKVRASTFECERHTHAIPRAQEALADPRVQTGHLRDLKVRLLRLRLLAASLCNGPMRFAEAST